MLNLTAAALWLIGAAAPCAAQQPPAARDDSVEVGAPVVVMADTLFTLYGRLGPFAAADRAQAAANRVRRAAPALAAGDSVTVTDHATSSELAVDNVVVMTVLDADAKPLGVPPPALAREYAGRITSVARSASARVTTRALLLDGAHAILATIVLLLLLRLIAVGFPRFYAWIETLRRLRLPALRIQQFELLSAGRLSRLLVGSARVLRALVTLLLFYIYVPLLLSFFPWTAPLSRVIIGYAFRPFAAAGVAFVDYLPNLFYLAAGIVIVRYLLAFVHLLFGAVHSGAITLRGFYPDWAEPTYKIVRVLVLAFAAILLYPYLPGANSDAFKGISIFLGVLFSLGSSTAVGNMVAGVVLTYTRAFQIGDRVQIADTIGDVIEKTLLVTRVRTIKNVAITIPNATVLGNHMINYTTLAASSGLILHTAVTIGYDAPWRRVHELLLEAARHTDHILDTPAPYVMQTALDDFYVHYELNATTNRADLMAMTYAHLHENIQEAFNAGGVEITSPHFQALRDGNAITTPPDQRPAGYRAPGFRVAPAEPPAAGT
jgi:small-conductance mechanosensitive channel